MEMKINKFAELSNRTLTTPAQVFGMNGVGKTTIYNAYLWCLTGKGKDGSDMNEAVYSVNDKPTERVADVEVKIGGRTFHKVCKPKYQRPRGTAEMQLQTLCSNTYEMDGVEVTMKQYNDAVSVLCAGKPFQMFSDIDYFQRLDKRVSFKEQRYSQPQAALWPSRHVLMSSEQNTGSSLSSCLPSPSPQVVPTDSTLTSPRNLSLHPQALPTAPPGPCAGLYPVVSIFMLQTQLIT